LVGYTAITAICIRLVLTLLPALSQQLFGKNRWTNGSYFLFSFILLLLISFANSLYHYASDSGGDLIGKPYSVYLKFSLITTFSVGIIPTFAVFFLGKYLHLKNARHEKNESNQNVSVEKKEEPISISGSSKEILTLLPGKLIYIEAQGNYVHIHYLEDSKMVQKKLRATLVQMEEQLMHYAMVRCHRAFIVNPTYIEQVMATKLKLTAGDITIPISKRYNPNLSGM
jgi:hypothetical protein